MDACYSETQNWYRILIQWHFVLKIMVLVTPICKITNSCVDFMQRKRMIAGYVWLMCSVIINMRMLPVCSATPRYSTSSQVNFFSLLSMFCASALFINHYHVAIWQKKPIQQYLLLQLFVFWTFIFDFKSIFFIDLNFEQKSNSCYK